MKILYLLDIPINSIGGAQKSTATCIEIMEKNNHDVWLMCPQNIHDPISNSNTIFFYYKKRRIISTLLKIFKIFHTIKKNNFDIVNAQTPESATIIGFLKKLNLIDNRVITVFTDRGFLTAYSTEEINRINWTVPGLDAIICTTHINQRNWSTQHPYIDNYCVNNIVEDIWFTKPLENQNHSKINIGFCGRFDKIKRWDTVENLINQLSNNNDYEFFVTLTYDNKEQLEKMEKYIDRLKKFKNITIYTNLTVDKMVSFYDNLDIFILTSEGESFGRTLVEAMIRKTIVIGTDSGGVPEVIEKNENLFEVNNIEKCIKIIKKYNKGNLDNEKNYFYNYAREKYSKDTFEKKLLEIYKDILSRG